MNYKTHFNGGILIGLYASSKMINPPLISTAIFLGGAAIGSLLPDIDHKNSYIGKKTRVVSKTINKLAGHRKLFHAPLFYLFLYSLKSGTEFQSFPSIILDGLFLGILSHLILDSFTIGGLPWFYPLSKKRFSLAKIKTNGKFEQILCTALICVNILIILQLLHIVPVLNFLNYSLGKLKP